jgi:hypothetical protein
MGTGKKEMTKQERQVTVGLVDLKVLIGTMFEREVRKQAEVMVLTQPGNTDASAAHIFAGLVNEALPAARKMVEVRYRRLQEALESGSDVGPSLKAFLHRD